MTRFAFGQNWRSFVSVVDDERVAEAQKPLAALDLAGKSFLDVGCGSGLSSLAARNLGARVVAFDYDSESVAAAKLLRERFRPGDQDWQIGRGDVLDPDYLKTLGKFDVVYAWGVLHHTGEMWRALENCLLPLGQGALLYLALYNDQGWQSRAWRLVKRAYHLNPVARAAVLGIFVPYFASPVIARSICRRENAFRAYRKRRGMSIVHDWVDWLGGYPYEVASTKAVIAFFDARGLELIRSTTTLGNNEYLFVRRH